MSTRCQIEFKRGDTRRTVYRHWDGYPDAVLPDLLEFLAWSTRGGDVEYESANFIFWSKRGMEERNVQLGFGICANDELHGDIEYYYVVEHTPCLDLMRAHEHPAGRIGRCVDSLAVPSANFFNYSSPFGGMRELPRVQMNGAWYFRDDRLREFRRVDNPHERITFDEFLDAA